MFARNPEKLGEAWSVVDAARYKGVQPLTALRQWRSLSIEDLADKTGLSTKRLQELETGAWIHRTEAARIAEALGAPAAYLYQVAFEPPPTNRSKITAAPFQSRALYFLASVFLAYGTFGNIYAETDAPILIRFASICIGAFIAAAAIHISKHAKLLVQEGRDAAAMKMLARLRRGDAVERFALYLRPFAVTGQLSEGTFPLAPTDRPDLEERLANLVEDQGPLVALGRPGEAIGSGRIKLEDAEWRDAAALLIDKASLIFMVPSHRSGTIWEFDEIRRRGLLRKVFFVSAQSYPGIESEWKSTVRAWQDLYKTLLPKFRDGDLFQMDESLGAHGRVPIKDAESRKKRGERLIAFFDNEAAA